MADFPGDVVPAARRYRRPFGAPADVRIQQLAIGAWEVGGRVSEQQVRGETIRHTAYMLWSDAGQPAGRDLEFWLAGEKLAAEDARGAMASAKSFPASNPPANTGSPGQHERRVGVLGFSVLLIEEPALTALITR